MYSDGYRRTALVALAEGATISTVSRELGVNRSTVRAWRDAPDVARTACPSCDDAALDDGAYAALLGYYLGDGVISRLARCSSLRVSCDAQYPRIIADVARVIERVRPGHQTFRIRAPGVIVVQSAWTHWPCVFPQDGPGRKHTRVLSMEPWQWVVVEQNPADFLRGLFHSDGCRLENWATQVVRGERRRYEYPRWQFKNESTDVMRWCGQALDLLDIPWRQSSRRLLSVSRRDAVTRLDRLIGPKR